MNLIHITDTAVEHLQHKINNHPNGIGFRLSIKKTGCSGYAYVPEIIETLKESDTHFTTPEGLHVSMDPSCALLVKGLVIDYVAEEKMGLKQKRLVFINPNEKNRCGCGESFTVE